MGANDARRFTEADMTPASTFQGEFQAAMTSLTTGLPDAKVFVGSIPDVWRIWEIGKDSPSAVAAWASFPICNSLLANPTSTAQADVDRRARVRQRIIDFNSALATVCASFGNCKFDNNAIFDHQWVSSEISTVDYIHPNVTGQANLAALTYAAGYGW